jgi:hypothetical protein
MIKEIRPHRTGRNLRMNGMGVAQKVAAGLAVEMLDGYPADQAVTPRPAGRSSWPANLVERLSGG